MSCFVYLIETDEDKEKMIEALKKYHEKNSETIKYTVVSELINENLEEGGDEV